MLRSRGFLVGETLHFSVRTSIRGTGIPTDVATVKLTSFRLGETETSIPDNGDFTRDGEGDYSFVMPTVGLMVGIWDCTVTITGTAGEVVLRKDRVVLEA